MKKKPRDKPKPSALDNIKKAILSNMSKGKK